MRSLCLRSDGDERAFRHPSLEHPDLHAIRSLAIPFPGHQDLRAIRVNDAAGNSWARAR